MSDQARLTENERRKIVAYDAARATVKIEGNTRAYYVLRAEAAEAELARVSAENEALKERERRLKNERDELREALREARPYVHGVATDSTLHGWRQETARGVCSRVDAALARGGDAS